MSRSTLEAKHYRPVDTASPTRPVVGDCEKTGHMPDPADPSTCVYGCGEAS